MAKELVFDPQDWMGRGDWDDMEIPKDSRERTYLKCLRKRQAERAPPLRPTQWPQEQIDLMTLMWWDGATAQQISDALGNRSRSAVIGRIDRMKLGRNPAFNRANSGDSQYQRGNGYRSKKVAKRVTAIRPRVRREPVDNVVYLADRRAPVLDAVFDEVDTGWSDATALLQWAA